MGALPPEFRKAADVPAFEHVQSQYGAGDPERQAIRKVERDKVKAHDQLVHDLSQADGVGELQNSGIMDGAAALRRDLRDTEQRSEKRKSDMTEAMIIAASISDAERMREAARAKAEGLEAEFEEEFGADWRQDIALRVFSPDEFPQRQDGESIEDYNARLENELIDKMIDPETGEIRPEYADDPEMRRYADWALARFQEREAQRYIDITNNPNATPEEREWAQTYREEAQLDELGHVYENEAALGGVSTEAKDAVDNLRDKSVEDVDTAAGLSAFQR